MPGTAPVWRPASPSSTSVPPRALPHSQRHPAPRRTPARCCAGSRSRCRHGCPSPTARQGPRHLCPSAAGRGPRLRGFLPGRARHLRSSTARSWSSPMRPWTGSRPKAGASATRSTRTMLWNPFASPARTPVRRGRPVGGDGIRGAAQADVSAAPARSRPFGRATVARPAGERRLCGRGACLASCRRLDSGCDLRRGCCCAR